MSGLTLDDVVQSATGSFTGTTGSASLGSGTTAGNTVMILAGLGADGTDLFDLTVPSGFSEVAAVGDSGFQGALYGFIRPSASAAETTWTLAVTGGSQQVAWAAFELSNVDCDWPDKIYLHQLVESGSAGAVSTKTVDTGSTSETFTGVALAVYFAENAAGSSPDVSAYTNGFAEIANQTVAGTRAHRLTVAAKAQQAVEVVSCTASISPSSYCSAWMLVLTGVDSHHVPDLHAVFGAEIGTAANITTSTLLEPAVAPFDEVVGTPAIVTTTPRSGSYCLEISSTSAAESVAWAQRASPAAGTLGSSPTVSLPTVWVGRRHYYFPSLPGVDVDIASLEVGSLANGVSLWYRTASQKLGVKIGTGTEVLSDATITAGQYVGIDLRYDPRTTTHTFDWAVDYDASLTDTTPGVPQTQASTAGMTAGGISKIRFGHTSAVTATYRIDDVVGSKSRKTYPIGDERVLPLRVDASGTPTIVGTSSNFRTFTANGTLATWTAAATVTNLRAGPPPVVGASASGVTQITTATGDYVQVPMETFTCAPNFVPIAGRWYWAGWAASGTAAAFGWEANDGTGGPSQRSSTDAEFDNATLRWVTGLHRASPSTFYQLTQAKVDGLVWRGGFSADAAPDTGALFLLFELAVAKAPSQQMFGDLASVTADPASAGVVSIQVTPPSGYDTNLYYEQTGTPTTVPVTGGTSHEETVNAPDAPTTNYVAAYPAAEQ